MYRLTRNPIAAAAAATTTNKSYLFLLHIQIHLYKWNNNKKHEQIHNFIPNSVSSSGCTDTRTNIIIAHKCNWHHSVRSQSIRLS